MKIEEIRNQCTGCTACMAVCPTQSIKMQMDDEGFYYPTIDMKTCISCGKCERVCHCLNPKSGSTEHVSYYGRSQDHEILRKSSSGGMFYHLAQEILADKGIVFGAAFDYNDLLLKHRSTDEVSLEALMKSKYVESALEDTILKIQAEINGGRKVLFCGTPCQVSGVKRAVSDPQGLLITCDFICHGVPSAKLFKEHLEHLHQNEKVIGVDFRPKERGWTGAHLALVTQTQQKTRVMPYYLDSFYAGFDRSSTILRQCCYHCNFRSNHVSDITIADFWGYGNYKPEINDEKGWSLIIANTDLGQRVVEHMTGFELNHLENEYSEYVYAERDYSEQEKQRQAFFAQYRQCGFEKAAKRTYMKGHNKEKIKYYVKKILHRA